MTDPTFSVQKIWRSMKAALIFALLLTFTLETSRGREARLAIISEPELEKVSLLLATALSAHEDLEILERTEITRILKEQRLERLGVTTREGVRLGALLKADGLVLMEQVGDDIQVRLVAVDSGAVAAFRASQAPKNALEKWSTLRALEIARLAPKLLLPKSETVPVSLMQINSALGGARGAVLEETISSLLATRLSTAPRVIVLERARLQAAVAEKELGAENSAFWNSAWVIDGSVTELPSGYSLNLRLQPPGEDAAHTIQTEAPSLALLVETANEKMLQTMGSLGGKTWDPAKEAHHFGEEALWAAGNGFWQQAARAMETAIALGESSPDALRWRWQCYHQLARLRPETKAAVSHNAKNRRRPGTAQIRQMTRSLELYHDALLKNALPVDATVEPKTGASRHDPRAPVTGRQLPPSQYEILKRTFPKPRFGSLPPIYDPEAVGDYPDWEGCSLLRTASKLILDLEKPAISPDPEEEQALADLRDEIHRLFDAMATTLPHLKLVPNPSDHVPSWNPRIDPHTTGPRDEPQPADLYQTRLIYGRVWEEKPEGYYAFVRQCLVNQLPQDADFFQKVLHHLVEGAERHAPLPKRTFDIERQKFGQVLLADQDLRCQVAGAFILCRAGMPSLGLSLFERHKELLLNGTLSVDYLTGAFRFHPGMETLHHENPNDARGKATGALKELLIDLLNHDIALTQPMHYSLSNILFTRKQAADLLIAFDAYQMRHPVPPQDPREGAVRTLRDSLAHRANLASRPSGIPPPAMPPRTSATPDAQPSASLPLPVDRAWVARNYDDASQPGAIRFALPCGDKIWLQVEFAQPSSKSIRRQLISLDLPSLKSRVIHRESLPQSPTPEDRMGPSFACDGKGIYFWNGDGIRYLGENETRTLEVPDLKRPFLWLVDGVLYAADEEGVLLKIDPGTGGYEILASIRRRPAQNALDGDRNLRKVTRIYRDANGAIAVKLQNRTVYTFHEAKKNWVARRESQLDTPDLIAAIHNGWDEAGRFSIGIHTNALLKKREPSVSRGGIASMFPAGRYLPAEDRASEKLTMIDVVTGVVSKTVLWSLLEKEQRLWLLRLDLPSDSSICREVKFSPEYQISTARNKGPYRMIPTSEGVAIYAPNEPMLWFLPTTDIVPDPIEKNEAF